MSNANLSQTKPERITLPDIPVLAVNAKEAALLSTDGELRTLSHDQAAAIIHNQHVMIVHAPYTRKRLGHDEFYAFDLLELYAFVHPTKFCVPTPHGLAKALGISEPTSFEDYPFTIIEAARALLSDLQNDPIAENAPPLKIAEIMGMQGKGWAWAPFIFSALGKKYEKDLPYNAKSQLNVWKHMPEWAEEAPEPPPAHHAVTQDEAAERLAKLLQTGDHQSNPRPQQIAYTRDITEAFEPMQENGSPHIVLAEAGTGTGKTLGYIAPASVWAEKNQGSVWISTFTKNLQRQIDSELDRLYPNPEIKDKHIAVRKGRENYLCLLNLEDAAASAQLARYPNHAIGAGIMARWAAATKDGDLTGADFPGWLTSILGFNQTTGLADRRGECIFAACDHYHKCFIEKAVRKSKRADIVIANHALVMIQTALSHPGDDIPTRYIFDEGHHLFSAADSAFSAQLSARETAELRRWLLGAEGSSNSRARGLKRRAEDLIAGDEKGEKLLQDILDTATQLTSMGWTRRLKDTSPMGPTERFLHLIYQQVTARAGGNAGPYSIETQTFPLIDALPEAAQSLKKALTDLQKPIIALVALLRKKLSEDDGDMDADTRKRLDSVSQSLERRGQLSITAWIAMLDTLGTGEKPEEFVDWMEIERIDGRAVDIGMFRHWVDPMAPFAKSITPHMHGMVITSATLRDGTGDYDEDWNAAVQRTGSNHFASDTHLIAHDSPFDYAAQTKVFIINDVNKTDLNQVSGAYRALFEASGGGALGLFTAISRLRAVHGKIALPLEENGISLYSQHVDEMDAGTLVDIFRDDVNSCLLGTDAVRDGVDVPGQSLRLIAFDRVPWERPTILHKARREAFGKRRYDEMITRLKLKQAFGRLIRKEDDKGVFVMLDSMLPSRLHGAFPAGVEIEKVPLSEAITKIKAFLKP